MHSGMGRIILEISNKRGVEKIRGGDGVNFESYDITSCPTSKFQS